MERREEKREEGHRADREELFQRGEAVERSAPFYMGRGGERREEAENKNTMNVGMSEVERLKYETEMKLLMQEKQKLQEQMMWNQREHQMRDQMFQMMMLLQAGGKADP